MTDAHNRFIPTAGIVALVVFCLVTPVSLDSAQPDPAAPRAAAAPDDPDDLSETLKRDRKSLLTFERQQSVSQFIDLAREAIERKDYQAALPLIERIFSEPNSIVTVSAASEVASHEEAHRMLRALPSDIVRRYDESRSNSVRRLWDQAREGRIEEVNSFISRYADSSVGVEAFWWFANYERDHGRNQLATAAFLRVAKHPLATNQQRAAAFVAISTLDVAISTLDNGQKSKSSSLSDWHAIGESYANQNVRIGGETKTVSEWLSAKPDATAKFAGNANGVSSAALERLDRPVALPIWKHGFANPLEKFLTQREQKLREQGIIPVPLQRTLVVGSLAIVRTLEVIIAFDLLTGEPRWKIPNLEYAALSKPYLEHDSSQKFVVEWAQRRLSADSIYGSMTSSDRSLFAIQEPDREREWSGNRNVVSTSVRTGPTFNLLCCYSLDNGETRWTSGGSGHDGPTSGFVFLGSPLVVDDRLFVVAQRDVELALLAIRVDNGSLDWTLPLGTVSLPIAEDLVRSRTACTTICHDGYLFCNTAAGSMICIDPLLRSIRWSYQYPSTTVSTSDLLQGPNTFVSPQSNEPWWDSWREPFLAIAPLSKLDVDGPAVVEGVKGEHSVLVFTSPDTDRLHAIRLSDGKPLWDVPRIDGLFVEGVARDRVIVVEGSALRAHDLATGSVSWRMPTSEIGGHGAFVGSTLLASTRNGSLISVDTQSGKLDAEWTTNELMLGTLVESQNGWVAVSRSAASLLPRISGARTRIAEELKSNPEDEAIRIRAAFLDQQAGDPDSALARLDSVDSAQARNLKRQILIDLLRQSNPATSNDHRSALAKQLQELSQDGHSRFEAASTIGKSYFDAGNYPGGVEALLDGLAENLDQTEGLVKRGTVSVRRDRILAGMIEAAYQKADANGRQSIDSVFNRRIEQARKSRDRYALSAAADRWQGLPWGRQLVVTEEDQVFKRRSAAEIELRLLDAAGAADRQVGVMALDRLAARFDKSKSNAYDAYAIRKRLLNELSLASLNSADSSAEELSKIAELKRILSNRPKPLWPEVEPKMETHPDTIFPVYTLVPTHAQPGSLADRIDVWIDRTGNNVIFRGDDLYQWEEGESQERKLPLPPTNSPYRNSTGYMLREAWGVGRNLIVLVGTELFGISPLDLNGDPNPNFSWPNSIDLQTSPGDTRIVTAFDGNNELRQVVVDQLNRPIGKVGPVRAGYFCYQKGTKLVAAETSSGRTLWEISSFPSDATVFGDDQFVYVLCETDVVEMRSAVDGRLVESRPLARPRNRVFHHLGSLIWTLNRDEDVQVELHDLKAGKLIWSRSVPQNSHWRVLDDDTLALATPDGKLHLLEARTGKTNGEPLTVPVTDLSGIVSWHDFDRWYIALSSGKADLGTLKRLQAHSGFRMTFVTGTLIAVDRHQAHLVWERPLKDEAIGLDQSRIAPVLVQMWKTPSEGREVVLKVIDRRTGKEAFPTKLADFGTSYLLNPDPKQGILELKLERAIIRWNYHNE